MYVEIKKDPGENKKEGADYWRERCRQIEKKAAAKQTKGARRTNKGRPPDKQRADALQAKGRPPFV